MKIDARCNGTKSFLWEYCNCFMHTKDAVEMFMTIDFRDLDMSRLDSELSTRGYAV